MQIQSAELSAWPDAFEIPPTFPKEKAFSDSTATAIIWCIFFYKFQDKT